jgi:galactokinase
VNPTEAGSLKAPAASLLPLPEHVPVFPSLETLYRPEELEFQRARYRRLAENFHLHFPELPKDADHFFMSAPGRSELCGNHTDHNHGRVLAASIDLDTIAVVHPRNDSLVRIHSEGFPPLELDLSELSVLEEEKGTSGAIVRGMAAGLAGIAGIPGLPAPIALSLSSSSFRASLAGFDACIQSRVLAGSGLSSSAAYEVLIGGILARTNGLDLEPDSLARLGQWAENTYFGKPCGLMDQMACALGNVAAIDFADPESPSLRLFPFYPEDHGYSLVIMATGGSHADLTDDYAAIPAEMKSVADLFGKASLAGIGTQDLSSRAKEIRAACGDRAFLRAWHFAAETDRPLQLEKAILDGDMDAFLATVRASGDSSIRYLQNLYSGRMPSEQGLLVALALTDGFLGGHGACRVHGGGFAGTIQAYIPLDRLDAYRTLMEPVFGEGCVFPLRIRPHGVTCIEGLQGVPNAR